MSERYLKNQNSLFQQFLKEEILIYFFLKSSIFIAIGNVIFGVESLMVWTSKWKIYYNYIHIVYLESNYHTSNNNWIKMGDINSHCRFPAVKFCQAVSEHASKRLKTFEKLGLWWVLVDILPKPTKSKRKFRICLKNCFSI